MVACTPRSENWLNDLDGLERIRFTTSASRTTWTDELIEAHGDLSES